MIFSPEEIERYARQLMLADVGGPGQQRLKRSRLLVVGAGGLGAPLLAYAAAAGVGTIGVADHDRVALPDLHRQVIFRNSDIGELKVEAAARALAALNPNVRVAIHPIRVNEEDAAGLVSGYDIVADCTDNPLARYIVSDACCRAGRPLVSAAVDQLYGSLTVLRPFECGADGRPNPTYRCLFPKPPETGALPRCAEAGVLGPLTGVLGSLQAAELIKEIVGLGSSLVGRLLLVDLRDMRFETVEYAWDPSNPLTGIVAAPAPTVVA